MTGIARQPSGSSASGLFAGLSVLRPAGTGAWHAFALTGAVFLIVIIAALFASVAPAAAVETCPNEQLRTDNVLSLSLPDCRAYEQVSPVAKNGYDVTNAFEGSGGEEQSSVDGGGVFYTSVGAFPGAASGAGDNQYLSSRSASGWSTRPVSLTQSRGLFNSGGGFKHTDYYLPLSSDLSTGVLNHAEPALVAGAPGPTIWNLYVGQLATGSYQLVTNVSPPNKTGGGVYGKEFFATFQGASADFSHVIFAANDTLTPNAPYPAENLYEWVGGQLRLVGLTPTSGTSCTGAACTPADGSIAGASTPENYEPSAHAISADGSRIVFSTGSRWGGGRHIYDRLNGTSTVDVSASQRTPPQAGTTDAKYQDASVDGSRVLFTSEGALTNDAVVGSGVNLYDYNVETGQLTDLTAASDVEVQGVAGVSEDASYVYFVANGVLAANSNSYGDTAVAGQPNLYLRHGGRATFIATLAPADSHVWAAIASRPVRVTPDGAHLAFESEARPTGYDNESPEPTDCAEKSGLGEFIHLPCSEVYLYDAGANRLRCVSCNPTGARPIGPSKLLYSGSEGYAPRNLSADGSRLFFTSADALLPSDTNGLYDVYEWEAEGSGSCQSFADNGGCLYLISTGTGATQSYFADASPSGNDLFFQTGDSLVGQDEDGLADLYDARVGGGFAAQAKPVAAPACTSLEGCRSPLSEPPAQLGVASAELHGSGNLVTPPEAPEKKPEAPEKKHVKKRQKKHHKKRQKKHHRNHRAANNNRRAGR